MHSRCGRGAKCTERLRGWYWRSRTRILDKKRQMWGKTEGEWHSIVEEEAVVGRHRGVAQ